jgi:uncharacterized repeat protein (TIGR01451 family)
VEKFPGRLFGSAFLKPVGKTMQTLFGSFNVQPTRTGTINDNPMRKQSRAAVPCRFMAILRMRACAYRSLTVACALSLILVSSAVGKPGNAPTAVSAQKLTGHVPQAVASLRPVGKPEATSELRLAIGLPLRNQDALSNLLSQIYDPTSPQYRQYLTPEQFTAMFGPTEADYEKLKAFAKANGLTVSNTYPNRMLLDVRGTVSRIEKTFHVNMQLYQHPTEARKFFAPDVEPTVDTDVRVLHISGLNDFVKPKPASLHLRPIDATAATPQAGSGPNGNYRGLDLKNAYAPSLSVNGSNQMVGLLEFDSYLPNDITTYASQASISPVPQRINVILDEISQTPGSGELEVALDIEMVIAMASGVSAIVVYEGGDGNDILNRMATDNLCKQLSASWTFLVDSTTPQIFQEFAAQGQSYFNASGDNGAYTTDAPNPVDQPYVIAVGGTTLTTSGPLGSWVSEKVWNWNSSGAGTAATGGGISADVPIPGYQQGTSMASNGGSVSLRDLPDVAMVADNVYVVANGSGGSVGGTSVAAPLWAAYMALVNQQAASLGQPTIGFINPTVYAIGNGPGYSTNFHDITVGNNTNAASPSQFFAATNYDLCTGWGSPIGKNLINTLAPRAQAVLVTNASLQLIVENCSPANSALDPGETATYLFGLKNIGAIATTSLVGTLLPTGGVLSPSAPQTYGVLTGGGSTINRQFTFTAAGSCGGTVSATLQLTDNGNPAGSITFLIPLGKGVTNYSQTFDSATRPALPSGWSSTAIGNASNWITSTAFKDTLQNSAFIAEPTNIGVGELLSPSIAISTPTAQLVFKQFFNTETDPVNVTQAYDGGVLEISVSNSPFADILAAGGSFALNGYNRTISPTNDNPLLGRQAWAGLSSNFIMTVVNLPASAAGHNVQFKWRFGTDSGNAFGSGGWYIDTVGVVDGFACCNSNADLAISQVASTNSVPVGQNLTYSLSVSNLGPQPASNVLITDTIPANVTFSSASPGCVFTNGIVFCNVGTLNSGGSTGVTVTVTPQAVGFVTNIVSVASDAPDVVLGNNSTTNITSVVSAATLPSFTLQPTNTTVLPGTDVSLYASATGSPAPAYQWVFNGANVPGATTTTLLLTNVQAFNIGDYYALATNIAGPATSSIAHLTVLIAPTIQLPNSGLTGSNVSISVSTVAGLTYRLEYKDALTDPVWTPLPPPVPGSGGTVTIVDTNAPSGPARFYHVTAY